MRYISRQPPCLQTFSRGNLLPKQELTDVHGNEQRLPDMPTQGDNHKQLRNHPELHQTSKSDHSYVITLHQQWI